MLLFQKRFHAGIVDGTITLTFRQWTRPQAKPGGRYRVHPIGVVEVMAIERVRVADITARDAKRAGFAGRDELMKYLEPASRGAFGPRTELFRIEMRYGGEGDFVGVSQDDRLSEEDIAEIDLRLARLDKKKPWTRETLTLIAANPRVVARVLAEKVGRERLDFKADVVKLKKLGLTQSFEVGYDLSPRGKAYWNMAKKRK